MGLYTSLCCFMVYNSFSVVTHERFARRFYKQKIMENTKASSKPHFFKPLVNPNFRNEVIIPTAFFTRYLNNGEGFEKALLKTSDGKKLWEVEIEHGRMVDGWNDFVEDNDLHRGDILVFGYEGNCLFRVSIFDLTACEREYPHLDYSQHDDGGGDDIDEACSIEEVEQTDFEAIRTPKDNKVLKRSEKMENRKRKFEADGRYLKNGSPYFVATLMPSYVKHRHLRIPTYFSKQHGIHSEICPSIVIKDQSQRIWKVGIRQKSKGSSVFYFTTGWHAFCVANHLKEGDSFIFELTKTGSNPTMQFHDNDDPKEIEKKGNMKRRTEANETSLRLEGTGMAKRNPGFKAKARNFKRLETNCKVKKNYTSYTTGQKYFCGTISARDLSKNEKRFPKEFARFNGLNDRKCNEMIKLSNINGESWQVVLGKPNWNNQAILSHGWIKFAIDNELKVGDRFKLEVVDNKKDDMLIMKYYAPAGGPMTKREMVSEAEVTLLKASETTFAEKQNYSCEARGESYFYGIITKLHLIGHQMRLPLDFARSNGLDKKCDEMIKLRNVNGESWQVFLGKRKSDGLVYIGCGWSEFAIKNKLKAGDQFKLEVVIELDALIINYLGLGDKAKATGMASNSSPTATTVQVIKKLALPEISSGQKCNVKIEQE